MEGIENRRGFLIVNSELLVEHEGKVKEFIDEGIIFASHHNYASDSHEFKMVHPAFDEISPGRFASDYVLECENDKLKVRRIG